ncbi:hypothetical protein MBLNU459_g0367t1 [Dothideomycetes sp. NU459]
MAARAASPRRPNRPPARPGARSSTAPDSGPASKRRKYVPGGPGGGGRYVEPERKGTIVVDGMDDSSNGPEAVVAVGGLHGSDRLTVEMAMDGDEERATSPRSVRRNMSSRPRRDRDRDRTRRRPAAAPRPRYSSAAAAAAASQANDGYKPREERSWDEFHPDLDIEAALMIFTADEVDGRNKGDVNQSLIKQATMNGDLARGHVGDQLDAHPHPQVVVPMETPKRKPGRPPRRPESMLSGLGSPPAPRIVPLPTHNPKERLNLPKPSFRIVDTFAQYEQDRAVQVNYVDRGMANVGYQENDRFDVPQLNLIRHVEGPYDDDTESGLRLETDEKPEKPTWPVGAVEYDMDEQDDRWLDALNTHRKEDGVDAIKPAMFEITMTQIEREYHALEKRIPKPNPRHPQTHRPRSSSAAAVNGEPTGPSDEPDTKCVICDDGDCENANAIIFCDGCDLAVHQECYGVPFIPEGQWFCRKCKEIGRGTPTCIFCPNIDGAFKQTNTLRWSHLLCAIWIPEVTIANTTFMEPIQDVEKVPKSRWGLNCYICNQKMGARARLFLRMKATHVGGIDASVLKAFCDRHVPPDWRREHDVDHAIIEAKRYYRHTMRNRRWADSQTAALAMTITQHADTVDVADELVPGDDTIIVAGNKRKRKEPQKTAWRLPSGAPVVPAVVLETVENSLGRFVLRKKHQFIAEACKYWTLKREARKGAALLKRLQLQLESFSPMEITRRNFVGMGAAGRSRLLRRIKFAEMLDKDIDCLREIVLRTRQREQLTLTDTEALKELMDIVYFPIMPLLWPILHKAQKLDEKTEVFKEGLDALEQKLSRRYYTSVAAFSADIGNIFSTALARIDGAASNENISDVMQIHSQLNEAPAGTAEHLALTQAQKELKKLAKRIVKAVKEPLESALKKEGELKGIPFEKEMSEWAAFDARLENSIGSRRGSALTVPINSGGLVTDASVSAVGGASPSSRKTSYATADDVETRNEGDNLLEQNSELTSVHDDIVPHRTRAAGGSVSRSPTKNGSLEASQPLSPPISTSSVAHTVETAAHVLKAGIEASHNSSSSADPWARGGVPWYLAPFDIIGTTVHEERWTGPDTMRAMSEALSEMDDEDLRVLEQSTVTADDEEQKTSAHQTRALRRSLRGGANGEPEEETEKQKLAREKREAYNAKRRAQRKRQKW